MELKQLLESSNPYKSIQQKAQRLSNKWEQTGLLENLSNDVEKNNMSMILENQTKQLVVETSLSGGGQAGGTFTSGVGEQWAGIALPMVRKIFGQISSKEFVSVQPLNLPSGLVFFLDFQYGTDKGPFKKGDSLYGNTGDNKPFGNEASGGFYGAGRFSYSINTVESTSEGIALATATKQDIRFDSRLYAAVAAEDLVRVTVPKADLNAAVDLEAVRGFRLKEDSTNPGTPVTIPEVSIFPEFTRVDGDNVIFIVDKSVFPAGADPGAGTPTSVDVIVEQALQTKDNARGDFEDQNGSLVPDNADGIKIPELKLQMRSESITAKTRKLKASWTQEFATDIDKYQNVDAEAEISDMMTDHVSMEIDLEMLDMLIQGAKGGDEYWSAKNNTFFSGADFVSEDVNTGGFYNTQGGWFQTIGTKLQKLSNGIHQKTFRGGANFMVVSPSVATIIESIPGFSSSSDGDVSKNSYAFGVQKTGQLNGRYKVFKNPFMTENTILLGYRGNQFLEAGAVFAPYIPLIMTPLVYDPETFTPSKGLLTRFAKKMIRPEFYARLFVSGLETI